MKSRRKAGLFNMNRPRKRLSNIRRKVSKKRVNIILSKTEIGLLKRRGDNIGLWTSSSFPNIFKKLIGNINKGNTDNKGNKSSIRNTITTFHTCLTPNNTNFKKA
jgi:hypothetical protein